MARYEIEGPDGTIYETEAPDDATARAKVKAHLSGGQQQARSPDLVNATISGLGDFVAAIPGMVGDVQRGLSGPIESQSQGQRLRMESRYPAAPNNAPDPLVTGRPALPTKGMAPDSAFFNRLMGNNFEPANDMERWFKTGGAFLPNALTGRGLISAAAKVAAPTAGTELARGVTKGTPFESVGPMLGGLAGFAATGGFSPGPRYAPKPPPEPPPAAIDIQSVLEGGGEFQMPDFSGIRKSLGKDAEKRARQAIGAQTSDIARNEFNIPIRKGQATGNPDDIRFEQRALQGGAGEGPYRILRANDEQQRTAVQAAGQNLATQGRPSVLTNPGDAPNMVRQGLDAASDAAKRTERQAWDAFRAGEGRVRVDGLATLESRVKQAVADFDVDPSLGMDSYPQSGAAMKQLGQRVANLMASQKAEVDVTALNQIRRSFSDAHRAAANPADRELARRMNEAVNTWLDDVSTSALFDGEPGVIENLSKARALTREFHSKYGSDKLLGKILERDADEAQTINALFGASKIGNQRGAVEAIRTLKTELGEQSPYFQALREEAVNRIFAPLTRAERQSQATPYGAVIENMNDAITGRGAPIMRELYSPQELAALRRLQFVVQRLHTPLGNAPQTAYELSNMLSSAARALERIPAVGPIIKFAFSGLGDAHGTIRANAAVRPIQMPKSYARVQAPPPGYKPGASTRVRPVKRKDLPLWRSNPMERQ